MHGKGGGFVDGICNVICPKDTNSSWFDYLHVRYYNDEYWFQRRSQLSGGKTVGAVMFVFGLTAVVVGLAALKVRRREKKKMRGMATQQARKKYALNGISNGNISIISNDISLEADLTLSPKIILCCH